MDTDERRAPEVMALGVQLSAMSVSGACQICGTQPARNQCEQCGAIVCTRHYEPGLGLCTECAGPGGGRQL